MGLTEHRLQVDLAFGVAGKGEGRQVSGAHAAGAAVTARADHVAAVLLAR